MYFGACYYPEHWPEERWETDAKLMKAAGFNAVRMGEFAWTKMEREEGRYDFEWLDRAVRLFAGYGIKSILGTPTAAPPKWLVDKHPDICPTDEQGRVMGFGHRRYYCFNNRTYHGYVRKIVGRMADNYALDENVLGFQIDNEFGCGNTTRCYCSNCLSEFRNWLADRYGSLEALNENWGTVFSNLTYTSWDELILPGYCAFNVHNPGLMLDYRRFASDSVAAFQKIQADILKSKMPEKFITHNLMGGFGQIDYINLAKDLNVVSLDIYPNATLSETINPENPAIQLDAARGTKGRNFWILEHQSGAPGGGTMFATPRPGDLRRWTYQSIARGADAIVYFRFRTCPFGAEEYWHGILNHSGIPGRRYEEVKLVGMEMDKISGLIENSTSGAKVAMIRSFDNAWAFEIQPHVQNFRYNIHFKLYYSYFYRHNIPVDIISTEDDFSGYDIILAPSLIMSTESLVKKLYNYVYSGGYVVLDFRAGAKEWNNRMVLSPLPGGFREMLGIVIEEYGVLLKREGIPLEYFGINGLDPSAEQYSGLVWYDVIGLNGAKSLAVYKSDYYCGKPVITRNSFGKGNAFYIGTEIDEGLMERFMDDICHSIGIGPLLGIAAKGIEVFQRINSSKKYYFVINHNRENRKVYFNKSYTDILSGRRIINEVDIEANGVLILENENSD